MWNFNATANGGAAKTFAARHNFKKTALAKASWLRRAFGKLFKHLLFTAASDADYNLVGGEIIKYGNE